MSATNTTPNIGLPSFIGTDKPSWLTDWNGAMSTIDTEVGSLKTDLSGDETRIGNLENSVSSLNTTVSNHTTSITALNTQVSNQGGTINTITSLIGNGTPTTTDQTIIGAINEINAKVHGNNIEHFASTISVTADGVKTIETLLNELIAQFTAIVRAASNDRYFYVNRIVAVNFSLFNHFSGIFHGDDAISFLAYGQNISSNRNLFEHREITVSNGLITEYAGYTMNISASSNTIDDLRSNVPANGSTLSLAYREYEGM